MILDYKPNSIAKLIQYSRTINGIYPIENITFVIIDIGYDSTEVSIIKNGIIQVSRVVEIAGKHIDQNILNFSEYSQEEVEEKKKSHR